MYDDKEEGKQEEEVEEVPLLVIGSGRAALTLVSHLPEQMLSGAVIVDPTGNWLDTWATRCMRQGVTYLRTPVTQVPFLNCTGLQDFIRARGDTEVDAVQSSARYVPLPSCQVFAEYCATQVAQHERFRRVRIIADNVIDLSHVLSGLGDGSGGAIRVTLSSGRTMVARQVVHAGRWSTPVVPSWMVEARLFSQSHAVAQGELGGKGDSGTRENGAEGGVVDSYSGDGTLATLADVDVRTANVEGRSVVVVGGGMGACSLATAALRHGASHVTLLSRGIVRRREQECDVAFFGNKGLRKFRAVHEPAKRLEILREARGGFATINSQMWAQVQDAVTSGGGRGDREIMTQRLRIIERREVERVEWCEGAGKWRIVLVSSPCAGSGEETGNTDTDTRTSTPTSGGDHIQCDDKGHMAAEMELTADFVWAACGDIVDASRDPALKSLLRDGGSIVGGLPVLIEDEAQTPKDGDASSSSGIDQTRNIGRGPGSMGVAAGGTAHAAAAGPGGVGSLRWPGAPLYFVGAYCALSVGPGASLPAGHRLAARAVAAAMHTAAKECRKGKNPYAARLSERQMRQPAPEEVEIDGGIPRVLRLVPKSERHRALMDARELHVAPEDAVLPHEELSRYEVIDEDFLIQVRLILPEAVPAGRVRVAFTDQSVEVWAAGEKAFYRFFVAKLYKPIIVERCTFKVSQKNMRVIVVLHKFDNLCWRFLKG